MHRYAITYHRQQRSKNVRSSILCRIDGIGPARAQVLLTHFGTLAAVSEASVDELAQAKGMTKAAAQAVYDYFHK